MISWTEEENTTARAMYEAGSCHADVAAAIGRTKSSMKGWARRNGLGARPSRRIPIPADFLEYYPTHTNDECKAHWGCSRDTLLAWRQRCGVKIKSSSPKKLAVPDDFLAVAPTLNLRQAIERWGFANNTIARMYDEAGIVPVKLRRSFGPSKAAIPLAHADASYAGQAAQFLRRTYPNVCRATIYPAGARRHLPDGGHDYYAVGGRGFLHVDEMIALAEAKGLARGMAA
jgi:hypothetical protein